MCIKIVDFSHFGIFYKKDNPKYFEQNEKTINNILENGGKWLVEGEVIEYSIERKKELFKAVVNALFKWQFTTRMKYNCVPKKILRCVLGDDAASVGAATCCITKKEEDKKPYDELYINDNNDDDVFVFNMRPFMNYKPYFTEDSDYIEPTNTSLKDAKNKLIELGYKIIDEIG